MFNLSAKVSECIKNPQSLKPFGQLPAAIKLNINYKWNEITLHWLIVTFIRITPVLEAYAHYLCCFCLWIATVYLTPNLLFRTIKMWGHWRNLSFSVTESLGIRLSTAFHHFPAAAKVLRHPNVLYHITIRLSGCAQSTNLRFQIRIRHKLTPGTGFERVYLFIIF